MNPARHALLLLSLSALMGCAGDEIAGTAMWRHRDGSAVSAVDLDQSQAACRQAAMGRDRNASPFGPGNPAYHPGGIGLKTKSPPGGFEYSSTLPNVSSGMPSDLERIEACLYSKGIVRAL